MFRLYQLFLLANNHRMMARMGLKSSCIVNAEHQHVGDHNSAVKLYSSVMPMLGLNDSGALNAYGYLFE